VAILTVQFNEPIWPAQVVFQMDGMVELYGGGIAVRRTHGRKFGMISLKACDALRKMRRAAGGVQMSVALNATDVSRRCQSQSALVFLVARRAIWCEGLIRVVNRPLVARFAALVRRFGAELASLLQMAGIALSGKHDVRGGNAAAAVNLIVAKQSVPTKPQKSHERNGHTQNEAQTSKWMRALEIFQIDALGEFFGCELGSCHVDSLFFYFSNAKP
jgi:hypothetical protein